MYVSVQIFQDHFMGYSITSEVPSFPKISSHSESNRKQHSADSTPITQKLFQQQIFYFLFFCFLFANLSSINAIKLNACNIFDSSFCNPDNNNFEITNSQNVYEIMHNVCTQSRLLFLLPFTSYLSGNLLETVAKVVVVLFIPPFAI